jgi:hypothetical protein
MKNRGGCRVVNVKAATDQAAHTRDRGAVIQSTQLTCENRVLRSS